MPKKPRKKAAPPELSRLRRELAALRARYVDLYDLAPAGLFTLDAKGRVLEANLTVAAMLGVEKTALLKKPLGEFVHAEDRGLFSRFFKRLPAKDASPSVELRLRRAIAPLFWARLELTLGHGAEGSLLYRVVMTDVTARVQAQADLLRLRAAVDQAHDGIAIADLEGRLQFANLAWARMHGYAPDELLGRPLSISHTQEQLEKDVIPFNKKVLSQGSWAGEVGHVRRDGTTFTCWMSTVLLRDAEGKVTGLVGLADDLSQREAVLKSIPDLFYRLDADMNLQDWNDVFERLSGYSSSELKGMNALDFFARDAKIAAEGIAEAVGKGLAYRTARLLTKNKKEIPIFWSAAALRSPDGDFQGLVGIGRDLTVKQK